VSLRRQLRSRPITSSSICRSRQCFRNHDHRLPMKRRKIGAASTIRQSRTITPAVYRRHDARARKASVMRRSSPQFTRAATSAMYGVEISSRLD
jgi:hypothetical protein